MIVVAIMAIVMTMSVPVVYKVWHKAPLRQAVNDVLAVCGHARAQAIMQGTPTEVIFRPHEGTLSVNRAPVAPSRNGAADGSAFQAAPSPARAAGASGTSAQLSDRVQIRGLFINQIEFTDAESARVRFFPNGTCDELTLILNGEGGEQKGILTEITTGLANLLSDTELQNLRNGRL
jgi:type II secretory pathway pseudopilin PulG